MVDFTNGSLSGAGRSQYSESRGSRISERQHSRRSDLSSYFMKN